MADIDKKSGAEKYTAKIENLECETAHAIILRQISTSAVVLECGPATGYMTRYLKEKLGCKVCAIERDPEAVERAKQWCESIVVGNLDQLNLEDVFPGVRFDFILFADVLEHLYNPTTVLRQSAKLLGPEGKVIVSIPNISHASVVLDLIRGRFRYRPLGLLDDTHIRFFTRESVIKLIEDAGLVTENWWRVAIPPEDTEFESASDIGLEAYGGILRRNPDWDTYQFIVSARPKEAAQKVFSSFDPNIGLISTLEERIEQLSKDIKIKNEELQKREQALARLNRHPIVGPVIRILRWLKRDPTFGASP